ncbi:SdiA-regulated domain-containing protein [Sansalvadorimonas verongulae]|uniref:SdiA-regulated domain-containing protein n=1 Tax=Sansalvadorimonas verongulae TaxID=2172824 RepID=UPI0018AD2428|nr:SdiA-regulated domain-containing protein [Sansalvadorimonas verongulae]
MAATLGLIAYVGHIANLDDILYRVYLNVTTSEESKAAAVWLNDYRMDIKGLVVQGIPDNLSGLTWNDDTKMLIGVTNSNLLAEISRDGELIRSLDMEGFEDVEAIAWMGHDKYLVADERRHTIAQITLNETTQKIVFDDSPKVTIGIGSGRNKGFEGLAWDSNQNSAWVAKERDPMAIYNIKGFSLNGLTNHIEINQDPRINKAIISESSDLSGLHYDQRSGNLLVLSDESRQLIEVTMDGKVVSTLGLGIIPHLRNFLPQPEGITMDDKGDIYIVSEPNLFYRFTKKANNEATATGV